MNPPLSEIRVVVPRALRELHDDGELCLPANSVRELLTELARRHPQVHERVCNERGEPRPHINVFVNEDHVRTRAGLDTPLAAGDLVSILPAVSGG